MSRRRPSRIHGLLPVAKLAGPTSHDVVDMARHALRERRIGHTGTLDPMAEGLLLLCVGQATRLQQFLLQWDKVYHGQIRLGASTTTYDGEGEFQDPRGAPPDLDRGLLDRLETEFSGTIEQLPPPYSAKKVAGRKMYELARNGEEVLPEAKSVKVHELAIDAAAPDLLDLQARTSTGFYVRSLAHDIGRAIGCGGYLQHLERISIGPYMAAKAVSQNLLQAAADPEQITGGPFWIPLDRVALPFPEVDLNPTATERFVHGQEVVVFRSADGAVDQGSKIVIRGAGGRMLGIGTVRAVLARGRTLNISPAMVFQSAAHAARPAR